MDRPPAPASLVQILNSAKDDKVKENVNLKEEECQNTVIPVNSMAVYKQETHKALQQRLSPARDRLRGPCVLHPPPWDPR